MESNITGHGWKSLYTFGKETEQLEVFKDVFNSNSVAEFVRKVSQIETTVNCEGYEFGRELQECVAKIKGDLFEIFTVIWLNANGGDRAFRIQNIKWAGRDQTGFDFVGVDSQGRETFIQSKFHSTEDKFESDRLETFFIEGNNTGNPVTRVLFTTASRIAGRYQRAHREGNLIVIGRKKLTEFADTGFWQSCQDIGEKLFS